MWQPDANLLAANLSNHFGLILIGLVERDDQGHPRIEIRPADLHRHDGFRVVVELGWRNIRATFVPGAFARNLIGEMAAASSESKALFVGLAQRAADEGAIVTMAINGNSVSPTEIMMWPATWQRLDLILQKSPLAVNTEDNDENDRQLEVWTRRFTGMVLSLMPIEAVEEPAELNPDGLPEGACVRVEVNRYERSRINRANCIEMLGDSCKACGFNFGRAYGPFGQGFIHVHHIVPVSELGENYVINPVRDLVPLCPNCHAMAHQRKPPLGIEDLKHLLATGRSPGSTSSAEPSERL
ncbi:HNH endonuclease [Bradyrhizobium tropiciagri]|uniref:HNH endonuclease n=1 Tax=Bradyrhizobium tropiciagri TaxID=312253 RepID=UPI001BA864E0|nr:HNH endonuclease [Bradyrhizobium tropiciagri]MBR0900729.1 HNH endonuclease [Bradyrhizobium tropiciagri]